MTWLIGLILGLQVLIAIIGLCCVLRLGELLIAVERINRWISTFQQATPVTPQVTAKGLVISIVPTETERN